jgi:hypothetical protein
MDFSQAFQSIFSEYGLLIALLTAMVVYLLKEKSKREQTDRDTIEKVVSALNNNTHALDKLTERFDRNV